jgi:hypothetical protein
MGECLVAAIKSSIAAGFGVTESECSGTIRCRSILPELHDAFLQTRGSLP